MKPELTKLFASLGTPFSRQSLPSKPIEPKALLWNHDLADELSISANNQETFFSGKAIMNNSIPVAMAYAGHQFGQFNPRLGDGRAHLLGEITDKQGHVNEIQLKGSGQTPYSRNGDGKCGIKPAVREYMMSEAMHALGVPTTRSLSVITTNEPIYRETATTGAVITRVAKSHLRVGTFEYFAARKMHKEIDVLTDFAIQRHFPNIDISSNSKYINLITQVIDKQIDLIINWMRVGFIHGVMNTDNTLLSGDTIDYGPCAMLGTYDPDTVFSSIDRNGRYAFKNQPWIAQWNMARFAECFIPLLGEDMQNAVDQVMPLITDFTEKYNQAYDQMMSQKLGLKEHSIETKQLSQSLLDLMFANQLDYTQTFVKLNASLDDEGITQTLSPAMQNWHAQWLKTLSNQNQNLNRTTTLMNQNNPVVIPRNHHIEAVLSEVEQTTNADSALKFNAVLKTPYAITSNTHLYQDTSPDDDLNYQTYCGT